MDIESARYVEEAVSIPCGTRVLEGILAYPEFAAPAWGILLLSPHPHLGGRMDNNVIEHLARRFAGAGCATLRFNYGGVGRSTLELAADDSPYAYWARLEAARNYEAALPDALAARAYLAGALMPGTPLGYVGYSFGSCIAVLLAGRVAPAQLALISPPVGRVDMAGLDRLDIPVGFVTGDRDFVFDADRFQAVFDAVPGPKVHIALDGCDHFFRKEEERVYQALCPCFGGAGAEEEIM